MSIVDAIGTTMDKLADRVGNAIFHEEGRLVPVLRFAAGRNAALDWAERQDPEALFTLERYIQKRTGGTQVTPAERSLSDLVVIGNELHKSGYPEQAQYFADVNGARGWVDGFLSYVQAARVRGNGL
jgi:hypothetical protein